MDVVLIGVSDRSSLWRHGSLNEEDYESFVEEYATALAEHCENVIVTPDDGVYTDIAIAFGKRKGKKPLAYYPDKDTEYGYEHLKKNFSHYDVKPIGGGWHDLDALLTKKAPITICVGFSPGTLIELSFLKYHQTYGGKKDPDLRKLRLLIDTRCIERPLPETFHEQISNITYYGSIKELEQQLRLTQSS